MYWMNIEHVLFHPIRSKEPPIFNFPTLDSAGPRCGEMGLHSQKQELGCFSGVHYEVIGWENWIL